VSQRVGHTWPVGRGEEGSSRQTGRTVAGEGQEAELGWDRARPCGGGEGSCQYPETCPTGHKLPKSREDQPEGPRKQTGLQVGKETPLWVTLGGSSSGHMGLDFSPESREGETWK
jgi:hypothetical protein